MKNDRGWLESRSTGELVALIVAAALIAMTLALLSGCEGAPELPTDLRAADFDSTTLHPQEVKAGHTDLVVAVSWLTLDGEVQPLACVNTPRGHGYQRVRIREISSFRVDAELEGSVVGAPCRVNWTSDDWKALGAPAVTEHGVLRLRWVPGQQENHVGLRVETAVPDDLDDGGRQT